MSTTYITSISHEHTRDNIRINISLNMSELSALGSILSLGIANSTIKDTISLIHIKELMTGIAEGIANSNVMKDFNNL